MLRQSTPRPRPCAPCRVSCNINDADGELVQREDPNVSFYRGVTISAPGKAGERGDLVDEIHRSWNRERLEASHGYIQWLFPIFAGDSMNWRASPLTYAGAATIREDRVMSERVRRSYVLFLDFVGFRLADAWTGRVEAATDCAARMAHLDAHPHNFRRISRILASLGHLGFRRYKAPLLVALEREIKLGTLRTAAAALVHHWRPLVHDEGSEAYAARTLERAEDRVDGACFVLSRSRWRTRCRTTCATSWWAAACRGCRRRRRGWRATRRRAGGSPS